mmetsp:Transcript_11100/g.21422  ORF Transcript_11100/g.21422 Transcript_11100/m.21422 type:complete len:146 (-) Transcript_11100:18-455(-)
MKMRFDLKAMMLGDPSVHLLFLLLPPFLLRLHGDRKKKKDGAGETWNQGCCLFLSQVALLRNFRVGLSITTSRPPRSFCTPLTTMRLRHPGRGGEGVDRKACWTCLFLWGLPVLFPQPSRRRGSTPNTNISIRECISHPHTKTDS